MFVLFCFFFYKVRVCGNPASSKSIGAIFPTAFAHFMSLSHFSKSRNISSFFVIFVMVIFDVTIVIVLGHCESRPCKTVNSKDINVVCVLTAPPTGCSPFSLSLLGPPYSLRHNNIEIRPVTN